MATFLNLFGTLGKFLTPPPAYTDYEYDGLEYRWTIFVFRPARESSTRPHLPPAHPCVLPS